jgi:alpha-glucosidase
LPGTAYIYQGEELGLEEIEDIADELRQDPTWVQSGFTDVGRDGCRVPLPWSGSVVPYGFSPDDAVADPWLPQPPHWGEHGVATQEHDQASFLNLYRAALALRPRLWVGGPTPRWLPTPPGVLAFARGGAQCWVNTGAKAVGLPPQAQVVLASALFEGPALPPDTAVWLTSTCDS